MTWMSALSPLQWFLFCLIPPLIVMLYFLKLRRTPLEVPSTYLWTRTIEDLHVNSIWQRLRNSLLLILQLLMVLFLILSLLRPGCQGDRLEGEHFIFMIDNSASMSAEDAAKGSRFEDARDQVRRMIDQMEPDDKAMLIGFSDASRVVQSYTSNKSQLRRRLAGLTQTQRTTDVREALMAASALANPGRTSSREDARDVQVADAVEAQLHIFSDGGFPNVQDFSLGNLQAKYHPIGGNELPQNVGITAFTISNDVNLTGKMQAFAQFINSGIDDVTVGVSLYVNDELTDAQSSVSVPGLDTHEIAFDLTSVASDLTEAAQVRLEIDDKDIYDQDNVAYNVINPPRPAQVLIVTDQNPFLNIVMETDRVKKIADVRFESRSIVEEKTFQQDSALGIYDLIIFDQCQPERMPACNTLMINSIPSGEEWKIGEPQFPTVILDFNTTHPVMGSVNMSRIQIAQSSDLVGPKGSIPLLESTFGTIMMIGPRVGYQDLVLGFPLVEYSESGELIYNSDWGSKLSFPLFVQNVVEVLGGGSRFQALKTTKPGELVNIRTQLPLEEVLVKGPGNLNSRLKKGRENSYIFSQGEVAGIYEVQEPESKETINMFAINLMDANESRLEVRDKLEIGFEEIEGSDGRVAVRNEYWTWLALAALAILMVEWIIYNRRVFI